MNRFANFLMFYVGWFACVAGAGRGTLWAGPATAAVLLLAHLALAPNRVREGVLVLIVGVFGFAVDTLQASAGLYAFSGTSPLPWLCPPWMTALWMLFAATLNGSMEWLAGRYRLAAVLGALFGPLSYLAGERLGAITLSSNALVSLGGIAIAWTLAMPALLWIREALSDASTTARHRAPGWRRHRRRTRMMHDRVQPSRAKRRIIGALVIILATALHGGAAEIEGVPSRIRFGPAM